MARSVVSIDDLTNEEIEAIFQLADRFLAETASADKPYRVRGRSKLARDFLLATLFFEASTRTRLLFTPSKEKFLPSDPGCFEL